MRRRGGRWRSPGSSPRRKKSLKARADARRCKPNKDGSGGGGKGSGRMKASEQRIENNLKAKLKTLRDGRLPGEPNPKPQASMSDADAPLYVDYIYLGFTR